jgi:hypothetical protein
MTDYAMIVVRVVDYVQGTFSYEWRGDPTLPVQIDNELLEQEPDFVSKLPWPLEQIDSKSMAFMRTTLWQRTDVPR